MESVASYPLILGICVHIWSLADGHDGNGDSNGDSNSTGDGNSNGESNGNSNNDGDGTESTLSSRLAILTSMSKL